MRLLIPLPLLLAGGCLGPSGAGAREPAPAPAPVPLPEQVRGLSLGSRPGPRHRVLEPLVGRWSVVIEADGGSAYRGEATIAWALGGRFLRWDVRMDFGGTPAATTVYVGYDDRTAEYRMLMISDLSTSMEVASGRGDLASSGLVFTLELPDPRSGLRLRARSRLKLLDADRFLLEQLETTAGGEERIARTSRYSRLATR